MSSLSAGSSAAVGFLFDPNKCTGCQACELACTIENGLEDISWRQVTTLNEERLPGAPVIHLSMACNHCADPPCMRHCPALAYDKDPVSGLVQLDSDRCIGCKYCSWACPYDAPKFDAPRGVMSKCTFCDHRQERGEEPACVEGCPTGALGFGPLATLPGDLGAAGLPTTEPGPSIRFTPWRQEGDVMGSASCPREDQPRSKITLRSEWPLLGFTLIGAMLVAVFTAFAFGAAFFAETALRPVVFLLPAGASMGLSSLHLGRKPRAWRAVLNIRRSWLSREIVFYSAFVGLAALLLLADAMGFLVPGFLPVVAAILGFSALLAMDRVYDIVRTSVSRPSHSADVLLTGGLWTGVLLADPRIFAPIAAAKAVLYIHRKWASSGSADGFDGWWIAARLGVGFVLPCVLGFLDPAHWLAWALLTTALGETIDRADFYTELEVPTPRRQMATELRQRLARPVLNPAG